MVSLSPKRLRSRLLDRFKQTSTRQSSHAHVLGPPIPIFQTTLVHATIHSRVSREPPFKLKDGSVNVDRDETNKDELNDAKSTDVPVDLDARYRYWVPAVLYRCVMYLTAHGLDEEGLYRVPGSSETIKFLKAEFNAVPDVDLAHVVVKDGSHALQLADVASLLKLYLRELTAPIIAPETVRSLESQMDAVPELRTVLSRELQPYEFYALSILFRHLAQVNAHSAKNKMDMHNLSIVFCSSSNLGIGTNLFAALAKESVWSDLTCENEASAMQMERDGNV